MLCALCQFDSETSPCTACGNDYCPDCMTWHECEKPSGLYPHQERGLREIEEAVAGGEKRICVTSPTGGGKTRMMIEQARKAAKSGRRVVIYTHRRTLIGQTARKFSEQGVSHGMLASGHKTAFLRDIQIASIWTVNARVYGAKSWELWNADEVIVDECFPAGTLIDGRPIETLREGDLVTSFNHGSERTEIRRVLSVMRRRATRLATVRFRSGRTIVCTPNHPVFCPRCYEYFPAEFLNRGTEVLCVKGRAKPETVRLCGVRQGVREEGSPHTWKKNVLLEGVPACPAKRTRENDRPHAQNAADEDEQPDAVARGEGQGISLNEGSGSWSDSPWWEWTRTNSPRATAGDRIEYGHQPNRAFEAHAGAWVSDALQDRCRRLPAEDSNRSGRTEPQRAGPQGPGCEEGQVLESDWVDSVQIHEQGRGGEFDRLCPDGFVYNLEVEWQHNYFANGVLVHNCHNLGHPTACKILDEHYNHGARITGYTATPVNIGHVYRTLIVAGTNSELRKLGLLVPCDVYGPDEPDLTRLKHGSSGEFVVEEVVKRVMVTAKGEKRPRIFGRVLEHYHQLNPDKRPAVLFAPGVPESRWFAEFLTENGIRSAHIDADTPDEERDTTFKMLANGDLDLVCNRFVLREGWDFPGCEHGILATAFGAPSNWLQAVGRILRAAPGKSHAILQDHGAHWWRPGFGSPNQDRKWSLDDSDIGLVKKARLVRETENNPEREPIVCPRCSAIRKAGDTCPYCGFQWNKRQRVVIQTDGSLKRMSMPKVVRKAETPDAVKHWKAAFWAAAARGGKKTFNQIRADWQRRMQTTSYPPFGMQNMPEKGSPDWDRRLVDVYPNVVSSLQQRRKAKQ